MGAKNLKGVSLGWAEWKKQSQEWGKLEKKNLYYILTSESIFLNGFKWT